MIIVIIKIWKIYKYVSGKISDFNILKDFEISESLYEISKEFQTPENNNGMYFAIHPPIWCAMLQFMPVNISFYAANLSEEENVQYKISKIMEWILFGI